MPEIPSTEELAEFLASVIRQIRDRDDNSYLTASDDWRVARHVRHRLIAEAAYYRWINRGRPFGEPLKDWHAAEAEVARYWTAKLWLSEAFVARHVRHHLTTETAYYRWINRGRPFGDPLKDWYAAEAEVVNGGRKPTPELVV